MCTFNLKSRMEKLVITREIKFTEKVSMTNMYEGFKEIMDAWNNHQLP